MALGDLQRKALLPIKKHVWQYNTAVCTQTQRLLSSCHLLKFNLNPSVLFPLVLRQEWTMGRTSPERRSWEYMSEFASESSKPMKTMCRRFRRWKSSLLEKSRWAWVCPCVLFGFPVTPFNPSSTLKKPSVQSLISQCTSELSWGAITYSWATCLKNQGEFFPRTTVAAAQNPSS